MTPAESMARARAARQATEYGKKEWRELRDEGGDQYAHYEAERHEEPCPLHSASTKVAIFAARDQAVLFL